MANNEFTIPIPARLKNVAKGGHVAGAKDIIDDALGKEQSVINQEVSEAIEGNTEAVAAEKTRAEGVEGGLNTRLQTVEQLAEISVGGGDIGVGTTADFESDNPSDLAKMPTVGAMLGGANDGVYDISARHNMTKYADLAAALGTNGANVPVGVRKGGMSIKFIQSSDNKYVQCRLMADAWSTDTNDWSYSNYSVVANVADWLYVICDASGQIIAGIKPNMEVEWLFGVPTPIKDYVNNFVQGSDSVTLDGLNKIISFLDGFTTSDSLFNILGIDVHTDPLSNDQLFNDIVDDFKCTAEFAETYNCLQISFAQSKGSGKYGCAFIFYKTGWNPAISFFEKDFDNRDAAIAYFKDELQGKTIEDKDYKIRFKSNFSGSEGKYRYGQITYSDYCLAYSGKVLDSLSTLTLEQDKADNILRDKIKERKYKEAILDLEHAELILNYDINEEMAKETFQMLRTDEIVVNDNILLSPGNQLGVNGFDGSFSGSAKRYFCMHELSSEAHVWDFSAIKTWIQTQVTDGKRCIPRMFTAASSSNPPVIPYTHVSSESGNSETNRIDFPLWIADIMSEDPNSQWYKNSPAEQVTYEYPSYWLLDYNVAGVRAAVIEGIKAFGTWLKSETVITSEGSEIPIKDAILYIEFNLLGSWGEGQMSPLEFRCEPEDLLELFSEFMLAAPDNVLVTGGLITDSAKGIEFTEAMHQLQNNVCRYGFNIEHFGAVDKNVHKGEYDKYAGKVFFTGEGAGWYKNRYWGEDVYLNVLEYMKRLQYSYVRVLNWTVEDADLNPLKNFHDTAFKCTQALAFIGYRFVLSPMYCAWIDHDTFRIYLVISNIGCGKCWWSFYEFHAIVTDENDNILSDVTTSIDITKCAPKNPANIGSYSLGNFEDLNTDVTVTAPTSDISFKVYVRVIDKYGIAKPLYFSNYGRVKTGELVGAYQIGGYKADSHRAYASFFENTKIRP